MISEIANNFQNITKFDILQYFIDYADFLKNQYSYVYEYFSGKSETIDSSYIFNLRDLINRSDILLKRFSTFATKLGNSGYWELQQYCQDLNDTLERITKLPKYNRVSKTARGYKSVVQKDYSVGGMKTIQDVALGMKNSISENELILNNDLEENDYDIDNLSNIKAMISNTNSVVVDSIIEEPIGEKVYGKDISKDIDFEDNDLKIVKYEDNVNQKIETLLTLEKGDIPEFPNYGRDKLEGTNYSNYNFTSLQQDLMNTFNGDDLFDYVKITDASFDNGSLTITCDVKTRYTYSTVKNITI